MRHWLTTFVIAFALLAPARAQEAALYAIDIPPWFANTFLDLREDIADLFYADIEKGIDANDYSGPIVHRTRHRAGVIARPPHRGGPGTCRSHRRSRAAGPAPGGRRARRATG